jgi:DNA gyrase subunit A
MKENASCSVHAKQVELFFCLCTTKSKPMPIPRPDLTHIDAEVRAYIESLEAELARLRRGGRHSARPARPKPEDEILPERDVEFQEESEPPTTINLITATAAGIAKRTPRHLYSCQRRSGMGIFDLETIESQPPMLLALADERQALLLITRNGRAFRLPVSSIPETPVRGRGTSIINKLELLTDETLAAILPEQAQGYLAVVSESGMVRLLRHHVFGEYMKPGMALYDLRIFGPCASACWAPGSGDLFIATRQGRAIRFAEKLVPPQGALGIRLAGNDLVVSITAVDDDSGVFLLGADGRGTIRMVKAFAANKTPGASGKIAMDTDQLVCALSTEAMQDAFIISKLSKIIRFRLEEIPAKEGTVQGVICMSLRADQVTSATLA